MRLRRGRAMVWAAGLLAALAVALIVAFPRLAGWGVQTQLGWLGVEPAVIQVQSIGLARARVGPIALGPGPDARIDVLEIDYSLKGLLGRRIGRIRVTGAELQASVGPDGFSLNALDPLLLGEEPAGKDELYTSPGWSIGEVEISDVRLLCETPLGEIVADLGGRLAMGEHGSMAGSLDFELRHAEARALGTLALEVASDGTVRGNLGLEGAAQNGPGMARVELKLTGQLPGSAPESAKQSDGTQLEGVLALAVNDVSIPEAVRGVSLDGQLRLTLADGTFSVLPEGELQLVVRELDPALVSSLVSSESLLEMLTGPFELALGARGEEGSLIEADLAAEFPVLRVRGRLEVEGERIPDLSVELDAKVQMGATEAPFDEFEISRLAVTLSPWELGGLSLGQTQVSATLAGRLEDEALLVSLDDCAWIRIEEARLNGDGLWTQPLELCFEQVEERVVRVELPREGAPLGDARIQLAPADLRMSGLRVSTPVLRAEAQFGSDGLRASISARGGQVAWPGLGVTLREIGGVLSLDATQTPVTGSARLSVDRVRIGDKQPWVRPLTLSAGARMRGDQVEATAEVGDREGFVRLRARAVHTLSGGAGRASLRSEPMRFSRDARQPVEIFPVLAGLYDWAAGSLLAVGEFEWGPAGFSNDLYLVADDLSLQVESMTLEGLNGLIRLDSLAPVASASWQLLTFEKLAAGTVIRDGTLAFRPKLDGSIELLSARASWAGGTVEAAGVLGSADETQGVTVQLAEIDLGAVVAIAEIEDLAVIGRFGGELRIRTDGERVWVYGAKLVTTQDGGAIRYQPGQVPAALGGGNTSVGAVLAALENFQYDTLSIGFEGELDGKIDVTVRLRGRNPGFQRGRPVELNLDFSGDVGQTVRAALFPFQISDAIQRRLSARAP